MMVDKENLKVIDTETFQKFISESSTHRTSSTTSGKNNHDKNLRNSSTFTVCEILRCEIRILSPYLRTNPRHGVSFQLRILNQSDDLLEVGRRLFYCQLAKALLEGDNDGFSMYRNELMDIVFFPGALRDIGQWIECQTIEEARGLLDNIIFQTHNSGVLQRKRTGDHCYVMDEEVLEGFLCGCPELQLRQPFRTSFLEKVIIMVLNGSKAALSAFEMTPSEGLMLIQSGSVERSFRWIDAMTYNVLDLIVLGLCAVDRDKEELINNLVNSQCFFLNGDSPRRGQAVIKYLIAAVATTTKAGFGGCTFLARLLSSVFERALFPAFGRKISKLVEKVLWMEAVVFLSGDSSQRELAALHIRRPGAFQLDAPTTQLCNLPNEQLLLMSGDAVALNDLILPSDVWNHHILKFIGRSWTISIVAVIKNQLNRTLSTTPTDLQCDDEVDNDNTNERKDKKGSEYIVTCEIKEEALQHILTILKRRPSRDLFLCFNAIIRDSISGFFSSNEKTALQLIHNYKHSQQSYVNDINIRHSCIIDSHLLFRLGDANWVLINEDQLMWCIDFKDFAHSKDSTVIVDMFQETERDSNIFIRSNAISLIGSEGLCSPSPQFFKALRLLSLAIATARGISTKSIDLSKIFASANHTDTNHDRMVDSFFQPLLKRNKMDIALTFMTRLAQRMSLRSLTSATRTVWKLLDFEVALFVERKLKNRPLYEALASHNRRESGKEFPLQHYHNLAMNAVPKAGGRD